MAVAEGYEETVLFVNNVALKAKPDVTSLALLDMPKGRGKKETKSTSQRKGGSVRIKHPMVEEYNNPSATLPIEQLTGQNGQAPAGQHGEEPVCHHAQQAATGQQSVGQQPVSQHAQQAARQQPTGEQATT